MVHPRPDLRIVRSPPEEGPAHERELAPADAELLAMVRRGSPAAAAALYDRVRPQVDRTIYKLLGGKDSDFPDLAQMALIELVTTIGRYRGDCLLDTWVSTVTAHVVYKHLRRRQAERRLLKNLAADESLGGSGRWGRADTARDALRRVVGHLAKIDEGHSWAYVLHDVFGYDVREVAQVLGISAAAAQSRLVRGRKQLHERIAADPELAPLLLRMEGRS
jgi:RNA polymerase sigma-70 factor (ECF subfamily)